MSFLRPGRSRDDRGAGSPSGYGGPGGLSGIPWLPGAIAPALSLIGLVIVASVSLGLVNGQLPTLPGGGGGQGPDASGGPNRTATPSNVVVVDPRAGVLGSILYAKDGNIWVQAGDKATQLTNSGRDYQPTWSPDGSAIYFVRDTPNSGRFRINGSVKAYDLQIPQLIRMNPDGTNQKVLLTGAYRSGRYNWSYFITQPSISPDGKAAVIITDGPAPTRSDIVLKFLNLSTRAISDPKLPESEGLGHQDPMYSPDGRFVAYVKNAREGSKGAAQVVRYTISNKSNRVMTGPGYSQPAWSPDGRYLAVTKTSSAGTDILIIDAGSGAEVLRLTNDNSSFAPRWSPAGDSIAYLKVVRGVIDLWVVKLAGNGPAWQVGDSVALTLSAGLDGTSGESWFIPPDQLPKPTRSPTPTVGPATGAPSPGPS